MLLAGARYDLPLGCQKHVDAVTIAHVGNSFIRLALGNALALACFGFADSYCILSDQLQPSVLDSCFLSPEPMRAFCMFFEDSAGIEIETLCMHAIGGTSAHKLFHLRVQCLMW